MKGVDTPVEDTFGVSDTDPNLYVAYLDMAVYPGVKTVIDTTNSPWEFGVGTPELEARYHHGFKTSLGMCREQADNSPEPAGVFRSWRCRCTQRTTKRRLPAWNGSVGPQGVRTHLVCTVPGLCRPEQSSGAHEPWADHYLQPITETAEGLHLLFSGASGWQ